MKRLTDFHIAALSATVSLVGATGATAVDVWWAWTEYTISGMDHLDNVAIGLFLGLVLIIASAVILIWSVKRHNDTGKKPIQSKDDIDYRIALAMRRSCINKLRLKEKAIKHRKRR
jgi:hypothetical protein